MSITETLASLTAAFKAEQWAIHQTVMWSWSTVIGVGLIGSIIGGLILLLLFREDLRQGRYTWFLSFLIGIIPTAFLGAHILSMRGAQYEYMYSAQAQLAPAVVEQCNRLVHSMTSGELRFLTYGQWTRVNTMCGEGPMLTAMNAPTTQLLIGPAPPRRVLRR